MAKSTPSSENQIQGKKHSNLLILTVKFDMVQPENHPLEKECPIWKPIIFRYHVKLWGCNQQTWDYQNYHQQQHPATSERPSHSSSHVIRFFVVTRRLSRGFRVKINGGIGVIFHFKMPPPLFRGKPWKMRGAVVEFSCQGKKWTRNSRQMIWRSQKYFLLIPIQTYLVVIYIDSYIQLIPKNETETWEKKHRKATNCINVNKIAIWDLHSLKLTYPPFQGGYEQKNSGK